MKRCGLISIPWVELKTVREKSGSTGKIQLAGLPCRGGNRIHLLLNHYQEIVFGESIENYVSEASSAPVSLWWEQYMSLDTRFKRLIRTLKGDLQEGAQGG